mgnify:CR=1 FL=1
MIIDQSSYPGEMRLPMLEDIKLVFGGRVMATCTAGCSAHR